MPRPKLRHLALFARKPKELAEFYRDAFEMEIIRSSESGAQFLSDGDFTLAILPHKLEWEAAVGLNHFGFTVDSIETVCDRLEGQGVERPKERPSGRIYAEYRGVDPEGNWFDLGEPDYHREQMKR
jgi:catechol 2,3-dioxygenase-like lactoylglutathione lyase family enzyme